MFGLSGGELAAIAVVGVMAFGPKDVPRIARGAGKVAGRAMGYLFAARDRLRGVADRAELIQLQNEVRDTVAKLQEIKRDALRGVQILPEAPSFASRPLMDQILSPGPESANQVLRQADSPAAIPPALGQQGSSTEASATPGIHLAGTPRPLQGGEGVGLVSQVLESQAKPRTDAPSSPQGSNEAGGIQVLPVSAQSAGLIPKRRGLPSGSDVLLEALLEERVAKQASRFMQNKGFTVKDG